MSAFNKFHAFSEALAEKKHNLGSDQLKLALCDAAHAPVATNAQLSDLTEISYTNCSSRDLTTSSSEQSGGVYTLKLNDLTLTASGGAIATFRYVVIYNDTSTNDLLLGWYDCGGDTTIPDQTTFPITFDQLNGVLRITAT